MNEMIKKLDGRGNLIYSKNFYGCETWKEYDENNNLIHYKNTNGNEYWYKYDEEGKLIYWKNSSGQEEWFKYDRNGNQIKRDKQIIINVKGGLVQDIDNAEDVSIVIRDYDIEGSDEEDIKVDGYGEKYIENGYYS